MSLAGALYFFALGDSKTAVGQWQLSLYNSLTPLTAQPWEYRTSADAGISLEGFISTIDTRLNGYALLQDCPHIMVNLGINNITGVGGAVFDETTNKASLQTIISGCVSRWPTCRVYLTKVWGQGYDADSNTFAGWVDDLVAANPANVRVGLDERITIKAGDNGATNTIDGIHYSVAGIAAAAAAWKTIIGY